MTKGGLDPLDYPEVREAIKDGRLCPPQAWHTLRKPRKTRVATRYLAGEAVSNDELLMACQRFARAMLRAHKEEPDEQT